MINISLIHSSMTLKNINDRWRKHLEENGFGVEGELDPVGLLLLLRTEALGEGGGQEDRPQSRPPASGPGPAELHTHTNG